MKEEIIKTSGKSQLVGVYTPGFGSNDDAKSEMAFVMLNSGLIHHVGPHRLHTMLGRELARRGVSALRTDFSGIGDSPATVQDLAPDELVRQELHEILNTLGEKGHKKFILFGICSGAKYALENATGDERIKGIILVNAAATESNSEQNAEASARFYLQHSARNPRAWLNLLTGKINYGHLFGSVAGYMKDRIMGSVSRNQSISEKVRKEIEPIMQQDVHIMAILSDRHAASYSMYERELDFLLNDKRFEVNVFSDQDHLFTSLEGQEEMINAICEWTLKLDDTVKLAVNSNTGILSG